MSNQPLFGATSSNASPWQSLSLSNENGSKKRSEPTPIKTPPSGGGNGGIGIGGIGTTESSAIKFNGNTMRFSTTPHPNGIGIGSVGGVSGGGLPKQSISFPKQNLNTTFTPTSHNDTNAANNGFSSFGRNEASTASPSPFFGQTARGTKLSFAMNHSTTPTNNNGAAGAATTPTFQPNSFLSRSSPSSSMSPASSLLNSSTSFIKPQNNSNADDLASSMGLRRRMNASTTSTSTTAAAAAAGHNGHSATSMASSTATAAATTTTTMKRPPLPNMTRLGVSMDTFDDFKENMHNGIATSTANTTATAKNMTQNIHHNRTTTTMTTPSSILKNSGIAVGQQKRPPQSHTHPSPSVSWKNHNNSNNKSTTSSTSTGATTMRPINYNTWVLIYGFTNSLEFDTILTNFENYGTITERFPSTYSNGSPSSSTSMTTTCSNWICVKYESLLEAEKALCQNQSLIHIVGQNRVVGSSRTGSNIGSGNDEMNNLSSLSSSFQDDIIAIGVMRVDENIAMKVGLSNYLEHGNTGFQRRLNSNSGSSSSSNSVRSKNNQMETKHQVRFANESDILLLGNEKSRHFGNKIYNGDHDEDDDERDGGVCEQVLSWIFQW